VSVACTDPLHVHLIPQTVISSRISLHQQLTSLCCMKPLPHCSFGHCQDY